MYQSHKPPITSVGGDESVLPGKDLPDAISLFHYVLEMIPKNSVRTGWAARRNLQHSGNLYVKIYHHVIRAQLLYSAYLSGYAASFKRSRPQVDMLLHDSGPSASDRARWVNKLGFRPIVFPINDSISPIPGISEAIDHSIRCGLKVTVT